MDMYSPKKRRDKNSSNTNEMVTRSMSAENNQQADEFSQEDSMLSKSTLQKRIEERLKVLAEQMKKLVQGKNSGIESERGRGRGMRTTRGSRNQTRGGHINTSRGRGTSINRGWPSMRGSFHSRGGMGYDEGNEMGRGYFTNFVSRGRGGFRGRGRGDLRGRGRIAQNNFDAKMYAEKCKALNKVPELAFKGVDLSNISGYAANLIANSNASTPNSKPDTVRESPGKKEFSQSIKKSKEILEVISNKKS